MSNARTASPTQVRDGFKPI